MMPSVSTTATVVTTGCFVMSPTQRVAKPRFAALARTGAGTTADAVADTPVAASDLPAFRRASPLLRTRGCRRGRPTTRPLMKPSIAGVRVRATSTAIATATAAAMPIVVRNGMRANDSPIRAMSTVTPAKTTADPAVPVARAADSSGSTPERT